MFRSSIEFREEAKANPVNTEVADADGHYKRF